MFYDHHISFLDDIFLAFQTQPAFLFCLLPASGFQQPAPLYGFGFDKFFLKIAVDFAGGLRRFSFFFDCPSPSLVFAGSKKTNQTQNFVGFFNQLADINDVGRT